MKRMTLLALLAAMIIPANGRCITRTEVIAAAVAEAGTSYQSAAAGTSAIRNNVYHPNYLLGGCNGHCIDHIYAAWPRSDTTLQEHSWYGAPYCYGGTSMGSDCQTKITNGYGVGASTNNWLANGKSTYNWAAGIDCSHFICLCLGISYHDTSTLPSQCKGISWDALQPGDLLIWPGNHAMIFKEWNAADKSSYTVIHASNEVSEFGSARVWVAPRDRQTDINKGFMPYTPNAISGDPAASLVGFRVENAGGWPLLKWETECERNTRAFWIERSLSPSGSWERITESIHARGTNTIGAEYRLEDSTYPGGIVFYRLVEQEIGWRVIIKREAVFGQP